MDVNMPRDKETSKTRGFAFVMYEDQRSTVLAVDNLNGANVLEKTLRVDHVKNYKQSRTKGEDGEWIEPDEQSMNAAPQMIEGNIDSSTIFTIYLTAVQMRQPNQTLQPLQGQQSTQKTQWLNTSSLNDANKKHSRNQNQRKTSPSRNTRMKPRKNDERGKRRRGRRS